MSWLTRNIGSIMTASGALTLTMLWVVVAPGAALQSTFGESLDGPAADVVVRNWGALVGLMGAMLVYAANKAPLRSLVLTVAGTSKAVFVALVLWHGGRFVGHGAGVAVVVDLVWVALFTAYLLAPRRE